MDVGRAQTVIAFVAFIWVFVPSNSNGNSKFAEAATISKGISLDSRQVHNEAANGIWNHCSRELKECIHFLESLESHLSQTSSRQGKLDIDLLAEAIIEMVIPHSPFQEKQYLFYCLRKKNLLYHDQCEEAFNSNNRVKECQELSCRWPPVPRRFLRHRENYRRLSETVRLAEAPVSRDASPDNSPAPSHAIPASSPSPILQPPSPVLQPSSPEPSPPQDVISPPQPPAVRHPPPSPQNGTSDITHPPPKLPPQSPDSKHNPPRPPRSPDVADPPPRPQNDETTIGINEIAVIAAGSVAGLALAVLLLVCCVSRKNDQVGPVIGQKLEKRDEKPLLNFCASDLSSGSSQQSQTVGNFTNQNFKTSSTISNAAIPTDATVSSAETKLATLDAPGNNHALLPLPPGRSAPPAALAAPEVSAAPAAPGPPPPPPPKTSAPAPPPPPKMARPPPNPPKLRNSAKPSPLGGSNQGRPSASNGTEMSGDSDAPKAKLKPFFWEKVMANPDHSMVWNEIKAGSFQFNEEMMESLFGYVPAEKGKYEHNRGTTSSETAPMYVQIIDPKKSQNLAILLKALNVTTEEVCDALKEGNELPIELLETLLKVAPTTEEELKLRLFSGDVSQLGPAERFLKVLVEIPFAFQRMQALLFMSSFQDETSCVKESFATLEVACKELRNSRLFLKLLEAVLKTGNRMNDGTYRGGAMAFKLDTLLKLSDVKGTDGKTTLLHFVVQEIIRSEGLRAARRLRESHSMSSVKTEDLAEESSQELAENHRSLGLQVVSELSNDLVNVRKAALIDGDNLTQAVSGFGQSLVQIKNFLNNEMTNVEEDSEFCRILSSFIQQAEGDVTKLLEEEKRIMALVKSTGDYFHGNAGKDEGLRLFVIVRDFLLMVDKACKDVKNSTKTPAKTTRREAALAPSPSQESNHESLPDFHNRVFPAIKERRKDASSSDEDN